MDPQPLLSYQNEGPASSQTFDEQPSMIPHAADLTLENSYRVNPKKDYHSFVIIHL